METTATPQQLYETQIKGLSIVDRLQLVKLVLDDLMLDPASWVLDENDEWSDEDYADLARVSLSHILGHASGQCSQMDRSLL